MLLASYINSYIYLTIDAHAKSDLTMFSHKFAKQLIQMECTIQPVEDRKKTSRIIEMIILNYQNKYRVCVIKRLCNKLLNCDLFREQLT